MPPPPQQAAPAYAAPGAAQLPPPPAAYTAQPYVSQAPQQSYALPRPIAQQVSLSMCPRDFCAECSHYLSLEHHWSSALLRIAAASRHVCFTSQACLSSVVCCDTTSVNIKDGEVLTFSGFMAADAIKLLCSTPVPPICPGNKRRGSSLCIGRRISCRRPFAARCGRRKGAADASYTAAVTDSGGQ